MPDVEDELAEVLDGASVSSISLLAREGWRAIVAAVAIAVVGPAGYGVVSAVERAAETLRYITKGIFTTVKRTVPRREPHGQNTVVVVSAALLAAWIAVVAVGVTALEPILVERTLIGDAGGGTVPAAIAFGGGLLAVSFAGEVLKAYKKIPASNAVTKWLAPLLQVAGVVGAGLLAGSVASVLAGMAVGLLTATVVGAVVLARWTSFSPMSLSRDGDVLADYWSYLPPAVIASVFVGIQMSSFNLLVFVVEPAGAGAFGIALIVSMLTRISLQSINQIFPQITSELYEDDRMDAINELFQSTSLLALVLALPIGMAAVAFRTEIMVAFAPAYRPYAVILPLMMVGQLCAVGCGTVGYLILMTDNERENMVLQAGLAAVILAIAVPATLEYGVYGLAAAYAVGHVVNNLVEVVYLRWREGLLSLTRRHAVAIGLALPLLGVFVGAQATLPLFGAVLVALAAMAAFLTACVRVCFTATERAAYRRWWQKFRGTSPWFRLRR